MIAIDVTQPGATEVHSSPDIDMLWVATIMISGVQFELQF
jgi:hypothetical protein